MSTEMLTAAPTIEISHAVVDNPGMFLRPAQPAEIPMGMGWLRDNPDFRDYTQWRPDIRTMLTGINAAAPAKALPTKADLRPWCSPIENQANLGACTGHAGVGLVE